jgi:hypothetical protein
MLLRGRAERIEGLRGDDQGLRRIEATGDADDDLLDPRALQPLAQAMRLDVVGLEAELVQPRIIIRHEGEALDSALQAEIGDAIGSELEVHGAEIQPVAQRIGIVAEGVLADAIHHQPLEIDIGDDELRLGGEALGLGHQHPALIDHRLTVPGEIGGGFARPRRGIGIGRDAPAGMGLAQGMTPIGLADGDIAGGEIEQHGRAGQRRKRTRRHRRPDVLADLHMDREIGDIGGLQQDVRAEGHLLAAEHDAFHRRPLARGELPALIEFAVVRQIGLRHGGEDTAAMDRDRAIEQPPVDAQRRSDNGDRLQRPALLDQHPKRDQHGIEQRILLQKIVDRIGADAELGKQRKRSALRVGAAQQPTVSATLKAGSATFRRGAAQAMRTKPWVWMLKKLIADPIRQGEKPPMCTR